MITNEIVLRLHELSIEIYDKTQNQFNHNKDEKNYPSSRNPAYDDCL